MKLATAAISFAVVFSLGTSPLWAAAKPAHSQSAGKTAPTCAALAFRPVPAGASDGEQTAGMYRSRFARLELRANVQNGTPANYYVMAGGTKLAIAQGVPATVGNCASAKKMPSPQADMASGADSCTGDRFTLVVAHADDKRYALLYAANGGSWKFCSAGMF
jgi:hypothetical protein